VDDRSQGVQLATIEEHFAAWNEPELFVTEVRAPLKTLR
jgi:hypothetical protein